MHIVQRIINLLSSTKNTILEGQNMVAGKSITESEIITEGIAISLDGPQDAQIRAANELKLATGPYKALILEGNTTKQTMEKP